MVIVEHPVLRDTKKTKVTFVLPMPSIVVTVIHERPRGGGHADQPLALRAREAIPASRFNSFLAFLFCFLILLLTPILAETPTSTSTDGEPIEVSTVRTVDYREAAVAAALALVISVMRLLTSVTAVTTHSCSTHLATSFAVAISAAFAVLLIVLPRHLPSQSRYAWQWFDTVCPLVLFLPLPLIFFRGGIHSSPTSTNGWNMRISLLIRELSPSGRLASAAITFSWISLATYLRAYDSIVFYFVTFLALEVGLTLPVAIRRLGREVLKPGLGGGAEIHVGRAEGAPRASSAPALQLLQPQASRWQLCPPTTPPFGQALPLRRWRANCPSSPPMAAKRLTKTLMGYTTAHLVLG